MIKARQRLGFAVDWQTGSHVRLYKGGLRVTVPVPDAVAVGTLKNILNHVRVSVEELSEKL